MNYFITIQDSLEELSKNGSPLNLNDWNTHTKEELRQKIQSVLEDKRQ